MNRKDRRILSAAKRHTERAKQKAAKKQLKKLLDIVNTPQVPTISETATDQRGIAGLDDHGQEHTGADFAAGPSQTVAVVGGHERVLEHHIAQAILRAASRRRYHFG